jgi:hypothetical protein
MPTVYLDLRISLCRDALFSSLVRSREAAEGWPSAAARDQHSAEETRQLENNKPSNVARFILELDCQIIQSGVFVAKKNFSVFVELLWRLSLSDT